MGDPFLTYTMYVRMFVRTYVPEHVTQRNVDRNVAGFICREES